MRPLKLALLVEFELGLIWTLLLIGARSGDAGLAALMLFIPVYGLQLACGILGIVFFCRRPETRTLAAAVITTPLLLLFLPALVRTLAGGSVTVYPPVWLFLVGLPLGVCVFLPRHAAEFLPRWTLRSRWFNVSIVVLLAAMILPWLVVGLLLLAGNFAGERIDVELSSWRLDEKDATPLIAVLAFAVISTIGAGLTLLTSYVGLFQRIDRSLHRLRVAQLVLSLVALAPSLLVVAIGLFLLSIAMFNPG